MRASLDLNGPRLIVSHVCLPSCAAYAAPTRRSPRPQPFARGFCQKSFFQDFFRDFFQKPPRELRPAYYEPGWLQLIVWRSSVVQDIRLPRPIELAEAWKSLMQHKLKRRIPLNSTQAQQCHRLLKLFTEPSSSGTPAKLPSQIDLTVAHKVLGLEPEDRSQNHIDLINFLHTIALSDPDAGKALNHGLQWCSFIKLLSRYGRSMEALNHLYAKWQEFGPQFQKYRVLESVARGLAQDRKEQALVRLVKFAQENGMSYNAALQKVMVGFYSGQNRVPETQYWFTRLIELKHSTVEVYRLVAFFAKRNNLQEWGAKVFEELGLSLPEKFLWDVILQAALLIGTASTSVKAMPALLSHMVSRARVLSPDADSINSMLRVALQLENKTMAKSILALGSSRGIIPNGETHLIELQVYVVVKDLANAQIAFNKIKCSEIETNELKPALHIEYRTALNQFLMLASSEASPDFKLIESILETVEENLKPLKVKTVAFLCRTYLQHDRLFDTLDLLLGHSFMYSHEQRIEIEDVLIEFSINPKTSTSRAWDAYQVLNQIIIATSRERRTKLMEAFFDRKRPDMAALIFGHMRQHPDMLYHPKHDTFVQFFEGLARHPDPGALGMAHNMLKVDTTMQPTTKLYTALMLAYSACGRPARALEIWDEITRSREGPSYASIEAIFWALEKSPDGFETARKIWNKIEQMDLQVSPAVYDTYIGAIASGGNVEEVGELLVKMKSVVGIRPNAVTLCIAYNALPHQKAQKEFENWVKKKYSNVWQELDKVRRRMNEYQRCEIMMRRIMKA